MEFYKTVSIITICILLISLAVIASLMISSSKKSKHPPTISSCPDFYLADTNDKGIVTCRDTNSISNDKDDCSNKQFTAAKYNFPGTGPTSGACGKKKWAKTCKVDWDGLTNNSSICYDDKKD